MNIIIRELRANLLPLLVWFFPLALIMYAASIEFDSFAGDAAIAEAMESFEILFQALGTEVIDMTSPEGFIGLVSLYVYLPLSIYSGLLGSGIISKEEKNKTAEYLFTLPVERNTVILSKFIVALLYSAIINIAIIFVLFVTYMNYDVSDYYVQFLVNMSIGVFLTQIIFLGVGMILSAVLKHYKKSGSITIGILMSTFMLSILIGMVDGKLDFIKFAIPFQYFPSGDMLSGDFNIGYIILSLIIFISTVGSTFYFYKKRDLYI